MDSIWQWVTGHLAQWAIPGGIGIFIGAAFKWFYPSRKEWLEARQLNRNRKTDIRVLGAIADQSLWKGARGMTGAGIFAVRAAEIAQHLNLDLDHVADSLERLYLKGKVSKVTGTLDDPSPIWLFVPR
jgi:hypothetical protein